MQFNIIGAGRLGKNLALALIAEGHLLQSVFNKHYDSAKSACNLLDAGKAIASIDEIEQVDFTFICTDDEEIEKIAINLAEKKLLSKDSIVAHCSGVLSSAILMPLKKQGLSIASLHPFKPFREGYLEKECFKNCNLILEGDSKAVDNLEGLFRPLGTNISSIDTKNKPLYHAAAVIASNYLITIAATATKLLTEINIPEKEAKNMIINIMQNNINNIKEVEKPEQALTGPLGRGDVETLKMHLAAMENPLEKNFYVAAAKATLPFTQLDDSNKKIIETLWES